ncbi:RND family efflux transporter MFP subunit [Amaricoccus macauensis]|uniref:RND family efflux transporter MFP subunit n=1 Tax=Amaricoccus macauensis TaxID=57001 RepID=A0A840SRM9_9RHOB|nr:efflux RND transporter periplasmic adaptor subunit [Amaricoccus macauensis]MBB5221871.1 RND family efflux transporter MFP subunit [Amaricoccus macauensis]
MRVLTLVAGLLASGAASAGTLTLAPEAITEWKPIYGTVAPRTEVPARARIGGLIEELLVTEGDAVTAGQRIAMVRDDKIGFQIAAYDAQIKALQAQLTTAETELGRGETLIARGVTTAQRLDQLRTTVDVTRGQLAAAEASRAVVVQQGAEGDVLAPEDGRVLTVPVTRGAVILAGEPVATIGSGGLFLRLSVPERHASALKEGDTIRIGSDTPAEGHLARLYPEITGGRVTADVEVANLPGAFVNARVPVSLPVGERDALLVPAAAVATRSGIDFVTVMEGGAAVARTVVLGEPVGDRIEVLTGLAAGDEIVVP